MTRNFPAFAKLVAESFQALVQNPDVFVVGLDADALYTLYLKAFPEGTNPIFKIRTEHDCSCCKHFIRRAGNVVAVEDGFADVQMGIGMVVWGLASVIIGEALVNSARVGLLITGAVMGSVLFRLLVAIALRWGLNPNDLKLITAAFVFIALVAPALVRKFNPATRVLRSAA